jgi:hypothetical protein
VLTKLDDYPIHQTPYPVAHTYSADLNHYDRYFFNGYSPSGDLFFAVALGYYPNRKVMDAGFSVVRDGIEYSLIASRRAPQEPTDTSAGPIKVTVEEPLEKLRVTVAPNDHNIEADLLFTARTVPVEEPHFSRTDGISRTFDLTRLTQWGSWSGFVKVNGERMDVDQTVRGCRDRSWGVRGTGERRTVAPPGGPPQFFWLWAPINFDDLCVHFDVNEDADGRQWHSNGVIVPVQSPPLHSLERGRGGVVGAETGGLQHMARVAHDIAWEKGTRRAARATIRLTPHNGDDLNVDLEPLYNFQMKGIGYGHPEWGHGMWKGEAALNYEEIDLAKVNPLDPTMIHIQAICRATMGDRVGIGVLEQAVVGEHRPSGFTGIFDGAK